LRSDSSPSRARTNGWDRRRHSTLSSTTFHTIVNVGYRSTNYWVVSVGRARLLVDLGWPGTMGTMRRGLDRMGVPLTELRYALATHYHIDHAGLAQEFKQAGVPLLVLETQVTAIPLMKASTKPDDHYLDIALHDNVTVTFVETRALLQQLGIAGEIVPTPGHSDDSVSLVLDDGSAFTGDLTPPMLVTEDTQELVAAIWQRLRERGARQIYPGHGPIRPFPQLPYPGLTVHPQEIRMQLGAFSISLAVKDIEASRSFYEKFGFVPFAGNASQKWLILKNGDHVIGLFQGMFEKNILTFNPGWDQSAQQLGSFTDVRELQRQLKEQGVQFQTEADEKTSGPASFIAVDPDGNPVLVDQHV
jgi:ribonuclease/clavin/mitogillin